MNKKDHLMDDLYNTHPLDPAVRSALDNFFEQPHFNEYVLVLLYQVCHH